MASVFDWVGMLLKNGKVIGALYLGLVSATGFSTFSWWQAEEETLAAHRQVEAVAKHLSKARVKVVSGRTLTQHEKEMH